MSKFEEIILAEIREVLNVPAAVLVTLVFLNAIEYQQANYESVKVVLKKQDISAIKALTSGENGGTSDNLLIYLLKQKEKQDRLIVILDKFDPWSNQMVLDVF